MPKTPYYKETKQLKKRHNILTKLKVSVILVLIVSLVVVVSDVASNVLSVGTFSISWLRNNDKQVVVDASTYYVLYMEQYDSYDQASEASEVLALQGASGFVWQSDDKYNVVGNIYLNSEAATSVKDNIAQTNKGVFVSPIKIKKTKLTFDDYSFEQVKTVQQAHDYMLDIISKLYDYAIKLETKSATPTTISSHVNSLKSECVINGNALDIINSTKLYESTISLKNTYVAITENLNELVIKLISNDETNHIIKYSYAKLLHTVYNYYNNIR